ncbi:hypothetical protein [Ruminococcus flavefaciens]|uniref:hypothetical protein n=1 Tax=Ruminococcus flavefaciens TaxID=1265 RepID=UPI00048D9BAF|nr:hypothetical protein [Ruminococcus flavefaciens]
MLWKKKDEDWGYIGNNVGESEEEAQTKLFTDPDYVKSIFQPFLEEDEQILWCMGGGKGNKENPLESKKGKSLLNKYDILSKAILAIVILGVLIMIFGKSNGTRFLGFLIFLPVLLITSYLPIIMILIAVGFIIWALTSGKKAMNFAITDRRVVVFGYGQWIEAKFDDIVETSVTLKRGKKGRIDIKVQEASKDIFMWGVDDPYRVKYLLDKAIEEYFAKQF